MEQKEIRCECGNSMEKGVVHGFNEGEVCLPIPCHAVPSHVLDSSPQKEWLDRNINQIIQHNKRTINPVLITEDTKPEWEKDFLDKFLRYIINDESLPSLGMLDHIRSTLLTQRNELEREIEGMKMEIPPYSSNKTEFTFTDLIMKSGYNEALQDVLEVLKGKGDKK